MYLKSVVFILKVFDAQSLGFNLLPEERRVHYLQWSSQRWRRTCSRENRRTVREIWKDLLFPELDWCLVGIAHSLLF